MNKLARLLAVGAFAGLLVWAAMTFLAPQVGTKVATDMPTPPSNDKTSEPLPANMTYIRLDTSLCMGTCPAFSMFITATDEYDGVILFEGRDFTCVRGSRTRVFPRQNLDMLITEFERVNFLALQQPTAQDMPDVQLFSIDASIRGNRNNMTTNTYEVDISGNPVGELVGKLIDIANANGWVSGCTEEQRLGTPSP